MTLSETRHARWAAVKQASLSCANSLKERVFQSVERRYADCSDARFTRTIRHPDRYMIARVLAFSVPLLVPMLAAEAAAQGTRPSRPDLVIGQVVDVSGPSTDFGKDYFAGAKTYFDHVNDTGGIDGRRIVVRMVDSQGMPEVALERTRELLDRERVDVLFGYTGESAVAAVAASESFLRAGIALVAPLYGDDVDPRSNVFPLRPTYAAEARHLVSQFTSLGIGRIAAVHANDRAGENAARAVEQELRRAGLQVVKRESVDPVAPDLAGVVRRIGQSSPQAVIVIADAIPVALFAKSYRAADTGTMVAGLSLVNHTALVQIAGLKAAEGVILTQVVPSPGAQSVPAVRELNTLLKRYRGEEATHVTVEGFLAAKALVSVLRGVDGELNRARILAAMRQQRRIDVGGFVVATGDPGARGWQFVDTTIVRRDGNLLR